MGRFCAEALEILLKSRALRAKILNFGIGYGLDFAKKGVIGYQTVKQGVIRYWREQKRGSLGIGPIKKGGQSTGT